MGDYWLHYCGDSDRAGDVLVLKEKEATYADDRWNCLRESLINIDLD
jgi:hypothetical protein